MRCYRSYWFCPLGLSNGRIAEPATLAEYGREPLGYLVWSVLPLVSPVARRKTMDVRPKHLLTVTAFTLVALVALSSAAQMATVIVCVGPDGHIDIESVFEGCCISGGAGAHGDAAELSITASDCGDCTDFQLKVPPLKPKKDQLSQPGGDTGCALCTLCTHTEKTTRLADSIDKDQHWQTLATLSTVVLLT